ncbi:MAG: hypothetical protein K1X53_13915 [Candidatus Sumerlaeaceae bacterium]|nr:hypothetical protein [Candidatus Sumerlaeaceae bacterium]
MSIRRPSLRRLIQVASLAVVLVVALTGICRAMTLDEAKLKYALANEEYKNQKFKEARAHYQEIVDAGIKSPQVYYNLGNACARLDDTGGAVLNYERARWLDPRNADLAANLKKMAPSANDPDHFVLVAPFYFLLDRLTLREWLGLFLVSFFAAGLAGFTLFALARNGSANPAKWLFVITGTLAVVIGLFAGVRLLQAEYLRYYIVMKPNVTIFSGPSEKYSELLALPEGSKVRRVEFSDPDWAHVVLRDGRKGFVQAAKVSPIY